MKNIFKYIIAVAVVTSFSSCEEDLVIFDPDSGQTAVSFANTKYELSIPEEDLDIEIPVSVTTLSSTDRTFNVIVDSSTDGIANEYSLGTATILAGSYSGVLGVSFDYSEIAGEDGDVKDLVLRIEAPEGAAAYNDIVSIEYFREIICNDLHIEIISDVYASETSFGITTADGTVVIAPFFPWGGDSLSAQVFEADFTLPDGDYLFTLYDSYGDGQVGSSGDVTLTGSYALTCSILTHASGEGTLANDSYETTAFTVNP